MFCFFLQILCIPFRNFVFSSKIFAFPQETCIRKQNVCVRSQNICSPEKLCVHSQKLCVPQRNLCSLAKYLSSPRKRYICSQNVFHKEMLCSLEFPQQTLCSFAKCLLSPSLIFSPCHFMGSIQLHTYNGSLFCKQKIFNILGT